MTIIQRIVRALARWNGMEVYHPGTLWYKDQRFLDMIRKWDPQRLRIKDRHYILYHLARCARPLSGNSVEFGVREGMGSWLILRALEQPSKKHFAVDSYEGLSEPGAKDRAVDSATYQWRQGDLAVGVEEVRKNLGEYQNVEFVKGWIPAVLEDLETQPVCFAHIDVDLYEPTLASLSYTYERLVPGGLIVCDDYNSDSCPGAKIAFEEFFQERPEEIVKLVTDQAFVIKL